MAVPRLQGVLQRLGDVAYAERIDSDDELGGALLEMLWPEHLTLSDVLAQLRPRRRRQLFGSYALFLRTMPDGVSENVLPRLMAWAHARVNAAEQLASESEESIPEGSESPDGPFAEDTDPSDKPHGQLDTDLLEAIVDRALAGESAFDHLDDVAALVWPRLRRFDSPPIPAPLDVLNADGIEPERSCSLRRALAQALITTMLNSEGAHRGDYWHLVNGWRGRAVWGQRARADEAVGLQPAERVALLGSDDFAWAMNAADAAQAAEDYTSAKAFGILASVLFDSQDVGSVELAYDRQDNPAWEHLRWAFGPVELDSEAASAMRSSHVARRRREPWSESEQFTARVREQLRVAADGDTDAFWQLMWNLQFDPHTGRGNVPLLKDDVASFPGMTVLGERAMDVLLEAAVRYLATEHDHAESWLGTSQWDKRAWAGYLALAALEAAGRLDDVPRRSWASWVGALVWFHAVPHNSGDRDRKRRLLATVAEIAPGSLATATARLVRGDLARGHDPWELQLIDPAWTSQLADVMAQLLNQVSLVLLHEHPSEVPGHAVHSPDEPPPVPDALELPDTQGLGIVRACPAGKGQASRPG